MDSIERVIAVLQGRLPDRPPVSFWHHFAPNQAFGPTAVAAHLAHVEAFDLDFLKVMNDNAYPHAQTITSAADLASLTVLRGDEPEFCRQLELLADLKRVLHGRLLLTTTVFNAWAVLRRLVQPAAGHKPPVMDGASDAASAKIGKFIERDSGAVQKALRLIGASQANFARRCLEAGADGIFLSVRDDWVEHQRTGLYGQLVRPTDLEILLAASGGRFNLLHVCGNAVDFGSFAEYPIHVINWADRSAGPAIAEVRGWLRPAICGGVDNLGALPEGTPEDCERQVNDAIRQAGGRPIMISAGCTYDAERVPRANLEAVCRAARR